MRHVGESTAMPSRAPPKLASCSLPRASGLGVTGGSGMPGTGADAKVPDDAGSRGFAARTRPVGKYESTKVRGVRKYGRSLRLKSLGACWTHPWISRGAAETQRTQRLG